MGPIPRSPLSSVPPSPSPSPPCQRYFDDPRGLVDLPIPLSDYEPDSSAATTPSSNNSMPSLCSCSDSDNSDAYSPLSLEELTRGNMKSKYFAVEPVRLSSETKAALADIPNEPRHFIQRTAEAGKEGDSTALTHITRLHDDDWSPANKFPSNNTEAISPPPFTLDNNQYVYQVLEMFHGPVDNSPLQHVRNELVNPFHPSYDSLRSVDEYKISTLALKIYDLITDLDVQLDQWKENQPKLSQAELKKVRITIFRAHAERSRLLDTREWGRYLVMQGVADAPAHTHIVSFSDADLGISEVDEDQQIAKAHSDMEIAATPRVVIFLKPTELLPGKEHIANVVRNQEALETYRILDNDPPFTFLNIAVTQIPEVRQNPWRPVISHLRIIRIFLHRFLGLICKQFFSQQWRRAIDRLSPEDDAQHFLYWHCNSFQYLDLNFPTYLQGFHHRCMHIDSEIGGLRTACPPRNLFSPLVKTSCFTTSHLFLNSKAVASWPIVSGTHGVLSPFFPNRFVSSSNKDTSSPSISMIRRGDIVPSVVTNLIYNIMMKWTRPVLSFTSFPANPELIIDFIDPRISSSTYRLNITTIDCFIPPIKPFTYAHSSTASNPAVQSRWVSTNTFTALKQNPTQYLFDRYFDMYQTPSIPIQLQDFDTFDMRTVRHMDVNTFENSVPTYTTITPFFSAYLQMNNKPNKNKNKIIRTRQ